MTPRPPSHSVHCLMDRHVRCRDGAAIRCACNCGHSSGGGEPFGAPHQPAAPAPRATEPDVPLTFVACACCGSLTDINAAVCPDCLTPRPAA